MDDEIYVYYAALPCGVDEMVCPCLGGYTVYIDKNLSSEQMVNAYRHALWHIKNHDFTKSDTQKIEYDAHVKED